MATLWLSPMDTLDPEGPYTEDAIHNASMILYKLTGEKYPGVQTSTDVITSNNYGSSMTAPKLIGGQVYNLPHTGSRSIRELDLRAKPVLSVASVEYRGALLDPSSYTLRNRSYLVRTGQSLWTLDPVHEIVVTYTHGSRPPRVGKNAAIRLANEFILWYQGDSRCTLPERVTSVARQGVSYTILDPQDFVKEGKTGVPQVDSFIAAVNPDRQRKKPAIFVPNYRTERINR